jgi:hypothetical protein
VVACRTLGIDRPRNDDMNGIREFEYQNGDLWIGNKRSMDDLPWEHGLDHLLHIFHTLGVFLVSRGNPFCAFLDLAKRKVVGLGWVRLGFLFASGSGLGRWWSVMFGISIPFYLWRIWDLQHALI